MRYSFTIFCLLFFICNLLSAPPVTIWNSQNTASVRVSTTTGALAADVSGSSVAVSNFPSDYPDANANAKLTATNNTLSTIHTDMLKTTHIPLLRNVWVTSGTISVNNFPTDYFKAGQLIGNTTFSVKQEGNWFISKATVVVENQVSAVSVNNFPTNYNTTGSTIVAMQFNGEVWITSGTVTLNDTQINRVVIRNVSPDRNLAINTYNGIDVRLHNNVGTLISDTSPLPVNYSVMLSSYVNTNLTGTIRSGSTYFKGLVIGTGGNKSSITIRNGTSVTAPIVAVVDTTAVGAIDFGVILGSGLFIETTGTSPAKITIIYR